MSELRRSVRADPIYADGHFRAAAEGQAVAEDAAAAAREVELTAAAKAAEAAVAAEAEAERRAVAERAASEAAAAAAEAELAAAEARADAELHRAKERLSRRRALLHWRYTRLRKDFRGLALLAAAAKVAVDEPAIEP